MFIRPAAISKLAAAPVSLRYWAAIFRNVVYLVINFPKKKSDFCNLEKVVICLLLECKGKCSFVFLFVFSDVDYIKIAFAKCFCSIEHAVASTSR